MAEILLEHGARTDTKDANDMSLVCVSKLTRNSAMLSLLRVARDKEQISHNQKTSTQLR